MTTYTTIPNTDIDQDSPVTQPLMTALRDNPLAIAEADSSVAANLRPTVLLGTMTTTSGTSQTLSSLVLTPYKFLILVWDGVSHNTGTPDYRITGTTRVVVASAPTGGHYGTQIIDLSDGTASSVVGLENSTCQARNQSTNITTASTSITISLSAGNFIGGEVRVYGMK